MILDETLKIIKSKSSLKRQKIEDIFLSNLFNIVKLSDGSIGSCMNYYYFHSSGEMQEMRNYLLGKVKCLDPLLLKYLATHDRPLLLRYNLKACIISALSRKLILRDKNIERSKNFDESVFLRAHSATVVGFGGFMDFIITATDINKVHISDLFYRQNRKEMRSTISGYQKKYPFKKISISDGSDNKKRFASSDLVSITGSAFCNGTMDALLRYARGCKIIIIQGSSATIYPQVLFEKGVKLIVTTLKPDNLLRIASKDFQKFTSLLEGGLPLISLAPKND